MAFLPYVMYEVCATSNTTFWSLQILSATRFPMMACPLTQVSHVFTTMYWVKKTLLSNSYASYCFLFLHETWEICLSTQRMEPVCLRSLFHQRKGSKRGSKWPEAMHDNVAKWGYGYWLGAASLRHFTALVVLLSLSSPLLPWLCWATVYHSCWHTGFICGEVYTSPVTLFPYQ